MTLDETRLMANVNDRARRLFEDGYRARWKAAERLEDRRANGQALSASGRLLSAYALPDGVRVWVITEEDCSATTLLLPEDH